MQCSPTSSVVVTSVALVTLILGMVVSVVLEATRRSHEAMLAAGATLGVVAIVIVVGVVLVTSCTKPDPFKSVDRVVASEALRARQRATSVLLSTCRQAPSTSPEGDEEQQTAKS